MYHICLKQNYLKNQNTFILPQLYTSMQVNQTRYESEHALIGIEIRLCHILVRWLGNQGHRVGLRFRYCSPLLSIL